MPVGIRVVILISLYPVDILYILSLLGFVVKSISSMVCEQKYLCAEHLVLVFAYLFGLLEGVGRGMTVWTKLINYAFRN